MIQTRTAVRALWTIVQLFAVLGCTPEPEPEPSRRVLLFGIDGASFRVIDPMIRRGLLPNLAQLAREGSSGPLRAHFPIISPRIWTSMATGKSPEKHGISDWVRIAEDGGNELLLSSDRVGAALWNIASDAGRTVGVVNWLNTYPVEAIRGVMVSDFAVPEERSNREVFFARKDRSEAAEPDDAVVTYPASWAESLERIKASERLLANFADPYAGNDQRRVSGARQDELVLRAQEIAIAPLLDELTGERVPVGIDSSCQSRADPVTADARGGWHAWLGDGFGPRIERGALEIAVIA